MGGWLFWLSWLDVLTAYTWQVLWAASQPLNSYQGQNQEASWQRQLPPLWGVWSIFLGPCFVSLAWLLRSISFRERPFWLLRVDSRQEVTGQCPHTVPSPHCGSHVWLSTPRWPYSTHPSVCLIDLTFSYRCLILECQHGLILMLWELWTLFLPLNFTKKWFNYCLIFS